MTTTQVDLSAKRDGLSRPERFVLSMADKIAAIDGRTVEVERETTDSGSQFLRLYSPPPRFYMHSISVACVRSSDAAGQRRTWSLLPAHFYGLTDKRTKRGYTPIAISVDVYAR